MLLVQKHQHCLIIISKELYIYIHINKQTYQFIVSKIVRFIRIPHNGIELKIK